MQRVERLVETRPTASRAARSWRVRRHLPLYLMLLPAVLGLVVFSYYPMYGLRIAFQDYDPLLGFDGSPWVGFGIFRRLLSLPDTWTILRNTVIIASGKIVLGQLLAIAFALMLNEIRVNWYKRTIQSLSYLLHFLSWLLFGGILLDLLSLDGVVNRGLGAVGLSPVFFLGNPTVFPATLIVSDVWKEFGWSAIIYLAALTGIDPALQEAAAVDGATRWQRVLHINLPGIMPTIVLLATLNLGWVLNAGFEQVLVLYNPAVYGTGDIIDTYVYRTGLLGFQYSLGTAVGLLKSVTGLVLITFAFYLARRFANYRIF